MITQEELHKLLHYDPDTGVFTWRDDRKNQVSRGDIAGSVDGRGYIHILVGGSRILAHRLAILYMSGTLPTRPVHHKDRTRVNNSWNNLEITTHSKNNIGRGAGRNNTSGLVGLSWAKHRESWKVCVQSEKGTYLKYFYCKLDAVAALYRARKCVQEQV